MPRLSFVVPTKNREPWLTLCLDSLLGQSLEDIEIIVVNDGSTDGTRELLDTWYSQFPKIKIIHNSESKGAGASRNLGAAAAESDIIAVCDDDDVYINSRAQDIVNWFEKNPTSELVNFPYVSIDYFENILESFDGQPFDHEAFKKDGGVNYFCNPTVAYKRQAAIEIGGYPTEKKGLTDDYQFLTNWVKSGKKVDFCGDNGNGEIPYVCMHRILPDSMMAGIRGWDASWLEQKA